MSVTSAMSIPTRRLAAIGDSIVFGSNPPSGNLKTSFATEMVRQSGGRLAAGASFNQGAGGERLDQILARVAVLDTIPGLWGVIADGGVNDLSQGASEQTVKDRMDALFAAIWSRGLVLCWLELLPGGATKAAINAHVRAVIAAAGGRNVSIDTSGVDVGANTTDGTHFNEAGKVLGGGLGWAAAQTAGW